MSCSSKKVRFNGMKIFYSTEGHVWRHWFEWACKLGEDTLTLARTNKQATIQFFDTRVWYIIITTPFHGWQARAPQTLYDRCVEHLMNMRIHHLLDLLPRAMTTQLSPLCSILVTHPYSPITLNRMDNRQRAQWVSEWDGIGGSTWSAL